MKLFLILIISVVLLNSCSEKSGQTIISNLQSEYYISSGDYLKVNLGSFGDEEGARIFQNPQFAKLSKLNRLLTSSEILYEYIPVTNFVGTDSVLLILNRGSDGATAGKSDTIKITIFVQK